MNTPFRLLLAQSAFIACLVAFLLLSAAGCSSAGNEESAATAETAAADSKAAKPNEAAKPKPVASVRAVEVKTSDLQTWIFGEGTARAVRREFLSFESAGRIEYVDPDLKEGDRVRRGQVIAYQQQDRSVADTTNADANVAEAKTQQSVARANLSEANASLSLAKKTFQRYAKLLAQKSASQQEYDEAKLRMNQAIAAQQKASRQLASSATQITAAEAQKDKASVAASESRITSPIDGVLARLNIEQGYYFSPQQIQSTSEGGALNTVPVVIIDASAFEITVDLPSYTSRQIKVGNEVLVQLRDSAQDGLNQSREAPGENAFSSSVRATVYAVSPSVDPETRTYAVKLRTISGAEKIQDGEYVTAWIAGPRAMAAITIPLDASRFDNGSPFVFVVNPETSIVSRKEVKFGLRGRDKRQVVSGVSAGDWVVTEGRSKISDGDLVRVLDKTIGSNAKSATNGNTAPAGAR